MSDITGASVIRAIYNLGDRGQHTWPTAAKLARYLEADEAQVLEHLRELRTGRIMRDRQRKGQRVWMPWEEA